MAANDFPLPPYGLEKAIRHGTAVERLMREREEGRGEFAEQSLASALAFDAADFVWAALMLKTPAAQHTREIRNSVAEAIIKTLRGWEHFPEDGAEDC